MKKALMKDKDGNYLFLFLSSYRNNNRLYIGVETEDGEPYCDFTINLSDLENELPSNSCVFVSNDVSYDVYNAMCNKNMLSDVLGEYQYNMGNYKMVQIFPIAIKDYIDKNEYEKYLLPYEEPSIEIYNERITDLEDKLFDTKGYDITAYNDGYICDVFNEISSSAVDIYYSDIFDWAKGNTSYIDDSITELRFCGDIAKQVQMAQSMAYEQELYEHQSDVLKYYAYNYLNDNEIYLNDYQLEDMESYIEKLDNNDRLDSINDYINNLNKEEDIEI